MSIFRSFQQFLGSLILTFFIQEESARHRFPTDENILGHRQVLHHVQLLMYDADACRSMPVWGHGDERACPGNVFRRNLFSYMPVRTFMMS
jgi:hypothetical protein